VRLQLVKPGEQPGQAVGYLPDGTMVVVNEADSLVGESIEAEVESTIQTSAGRMLFARVTGDAAARIESDADSAPEEGQDPEAEAEGESEAEPENDAGSGSESDPDGVRPEGRPGKGPFPPQRPAFKAKAAARRNPRR